MQAHLRWHSWSTGDDVYFCWQYLYVLLHRMSCMCQDTLYSYEFLKAPNSIILISLYVLFLVIVKQSDRFQLWNRFTTETKLMSHFGRNHRLTHAVKGRSKSRNHNKRNLITAIKQEKGKHERALMPGHLKCLRSENIFAHKALWWWPCPFQHTALLSV